MPEFGTPQLYPAQPERFPNPVLRQKRLGEHIPIMLQTSFPAGCVPLALENAIHILGIPDHAKIHELVIDLLAESMKPFRFPGGKVAPQGINPEKVYKRVQDTLLPGVELNKYFGTYTLEYYASTFERMINEESIPLLSILPSFYQTYRKQNQPNKPTDEIGHFVGIVGYKIVQNQQNGESMYVEVLDTVNGRTWEPLEKVVEALWKNSFYQLKRSRH